MSDREQTPEQWAREESLGRPPRFGEIEHRLGLTTEPYRSWSRRQEGWRMAGFVCGVCVFGALATVGPGGWVPGVPGTASLGPMSSDTREVLLPLSLVLGIAGLAMFLVQWWRAGRRGDFMGGAVVVISLLTCASLAWNYTPEDLGMHVFVLMGVDAAGALILGIAMAFLSRPGGLAAHRHLRLAQELRRLPERRRAELLAEREEMLEVLMSRGILRWKDAERLQGLPLGAFWTAEKRFRRSAAASR